VELEVLTGVVGLEVGGPKNASEGAKAETVVEGSVGD
jgi:hypothetical protein